MDFTRRDPLYLCFQDDPSGYLFAPALVLIRKVGIRLLIPLAKPQSSAVQVLCEIALPR
jgi:hypothetical protein